LLEGLYEVVAVVVSFLMGFGVAKLYYARFKSILHEMREVIDAMDDALKDDRVTKDEVQKIVGEAKDLLSSCCLQDPMRTEG